MNIIILGPAYPYRGGIAASNECLAYQLLEEGHNVQMFTFTLQYPSFLFPGKTQYSPDPAPKGLIIHRLVNSINPFNWIKVGLQLKRLSPDVIITRYWIPLMAPCLGTIAKIARLNSKVKVIPIVDNAIAHEKRFGDKLLTKYFTSSMDGFVAMSDSVLKDLELFDTKKPRQYCPHPLYNQYGNKVSKTEAAKQLGLDPNQKYLLFFGLIRDYKGLELLMQALADKSIHDQDIKLIVAGEFYNNASKYHSLEEQLHLKDKIIWFSHFIPEEQVKYFFGLADMVVQPYISATQSGITQIAYHFDKPMLVTNVGGLAEMVPHLQVGYVVPTNSHKIAEAISDYYCNDRYETFVKNVQIEKQKYTWKRLSETIISVAYNRPLSPK